MLKVLLIQTAFTGDAILATSVLEGFHKLSQETAIQIVVRKGNETLFYTHPAVKKVHVWDKSNDKYKQWRGVLAKLRQERFDLIINLQRHSSTALMSLLTRANKRIGYKGSWLSNFYSVSKRHSMNGPHEIERNHQLIKEAIPDFPFSKPKLYPKESDFEAVKQYGSYYTIAPASVWFTKRWPASKWIKLAQVLASKKPVFVLGAPGDKPLGNEIKEACPNLPITNACGKFSLLQSAALMKNALMNYSNDSAPLHLASAMNAPITAIFCSTIPAFGFGPLSDNSIIWESKKQLACRPCGKHGHQKCPQGHFNCSNIEIPTDV